ncbi:MAG: DUF5615 family PIN-like protein [Gemmataceae bacterium]
MKFLADESVDGPLAARLRADGHVVAWIGEDSPGVLDEVVLHRAYTEGIVLLTGDKDFGDLVYRHRRPHSGVLLLRLSGCDEETKCELASSAIQKHGENLPGAFSVLTADTLRIRQDPGL